MLKTLRIMIFYLWSYFPILALTDDANFGTVDIRKGLLITKQLRFSIFNIKYGSIIFNIFTMSFHQRKFQFYKIIQLDNYECFNLKDSDANKKVADYEDHLNQGSDVQRVSNERDFLIYLLSEENSRIENSSNKINLYTTIFLFVIPLAIAFFDIKIVLKYDTIQIIIFSLSVYAILNITLLIFQSAKVRNYSKSKLETIKSSENTDVGLNKNYYYNWQMIKRKADLFVSYVLNIQTWIKFVLAFVIGLTIYSSFLVANNEIISDPTIQTDQIQTIDLSEMGDMFSDSSIETTKLLLRIQNKNLKRIYVITKCGKVENERIAEILNEANGIEIYFIIDTSLLDNELKIFVED